MPCSLSRDRLGRCFSPPPPAGWPSSATPCSTSTFAATSGSRLRPRAGAARARPAICSGRAGNVAQTSGRSVRRATVAAIGDDRGASAWDARRDDANTGSLVTVDRTTTKTRSRGAPAAGRARGRGGGRRPGWRRGRAVARGGTGCDRAGGCADPRGLQQGRGLVPRVIDVAMQAARAKQIPGRDPKYRNFFSKGATIFAEPSRARGGPRRRGGSRAPEALPSTFERLGRLSTAYARRAWDGADRAGRRDRGCRRWRARCTTWLAPAIP